MRFILFTFVLLFTSSIFAQNATIIYSSRGGDVDVWLDGDKAAKLFLEGAKVTQKNVNPGTYKLVVTDHFDEEEVLFERTLQIYAGNTVKIFAEKDKLDIMGNTAPAKTEAEPLPNENVNININVSSPGKEIPPAKKPVQKDDNVQLQMNINVNENQESSSLKSDPKKGADIQIKMNVEGDSVQINMKASEIN